MAEISRTGGPKTTDMKTWTVPLSTTPPRPWQRLFMESPETNTVCTPEAIRFTGSSISFTSEEINVPQWIRHIDIWIASASERYADQVSERDRESARQQAAEEERKGKVREANERFKNL